MLRKMTTIMARTMIDCVRHLAVAIVMDVFVAAVVIVVVIVVIMVMVAGAIIIVVGVIGVDFTSTVVGGNIVHRLVVCCFFC